MSRSTANITTAASGTEMTDFGKNVWILCEAKGDGFSVLFDLLIRDVLGTPVRDGSHTDEGVRARGALQNLIPHGGGRVNRNPGDTEGNRKGNRS